MRHRLAVAVLLLLGLSACAPAAEYMRPADLRPGMKGVMRTVMKGTEVEEIPLEVVDVIWKAAPGRDIVLVKLLGERIAASGVAQGMSGSPVYVDGKLVGALAYAWSFSREPYAGVTPIESMMAVKKADDVRGPAAATWTWERGITIPDPATTARFLRPTPLIAPPDPSNMATLKTPVALSGFTESSRAMLATSLKAFEVSVVQGGGAGAPRDVPAGLRLEPGGLLCVELIRGDIMAAAMGTVTEVVDDRVYGFGHPMYGNGNVDYPMAAGYVQLTLPRQEISFKIGTPVKTVGTLRLDHAAGIMGEIGPQPEMVKLSVNVKRRDLEGDAHFNYEVVKDRRMMLSLINAAVVNSLVVSGKPGSESTVRMKGTLTVDGQDPLTVENVFGGPQAEADAVGAYVAPLGYVVHNPFKEVDVKSLVLDFEVTPGDTRAAVRAVETDKEEYRPGETIRLRVTVRPYRGKDIVKRVEIRVPEDAEPGTRMLSVGDARSEARLESTEMPHRARPESLRQLLDFFREERPNSGLYVRLSGDTQGLALDGKELPDLPGSVASVLDGRPKVDASPFRTSQTTSVPTDFVVLGLDRVQIRIVKD
jgi:hypothetical protein